MSTFDLNNQKKGGRLGRGLESLLGTAIEESKEPTQGVVTADQVTWLKPTELKRNPKQPRQDFNPEKLKELSNSIKEKGILQPIVARRTESGVYEIIAGERRWRASQMAGLEKLPVLIKETNDQDTLELALIENLQRDDLNPMEEAEAYQRLAQEFNLTQAEIAQKVGKERATVANALRLLELSDKVKKLLISKTLTAGHAKALLSVTSIQQQEILADQVVREHLSVRATEKLVSQGKTGAVSPKIPFQALNLDISEKLVGRIAEELQKSLGTKVTIDYRDKKGKLSVHFYSDEELSQLVEKLKSL